MKSLGRIYLVDDDELILSMLSRTLEKEGYEVRTDSGQKNSSRTSAYGIRTWCCWISMYPGKTGWRCLRY